MRKLITTALVLGALGATVAACGDTRSNKELGGVATWPGGGSVAGSWDDRNPAPPAYYYGPSSYGSSSDTVTTTTRSYPPATYAYPSYAPPPYGPPPYPPPAYPPPGGYR